MNEHVFAIRMPKVVKFLSATIPTLVKLSLISKRLDCIIYYLANFIDKILYRQGTKLDEKDLPAKR